MNYISLEELKEKLDTGQSIEEIARGYYNVYFHPSGVPVPSFISVEQLIEIIEKAPELLISDNYIPVWVFLLLLVREKFNILDNVIFDIFNRKKRIVKYLEEENISNIIVCNTLSTIKQITKEQISALLSIMEERKNLLSKHFKDELTYFLIRDFLKPIKDFISEECFLPILDWVIEKTKPYFFKYIDYDNFLKKLPFDNLLVQEKLVDYFISAHTSWIVNPALSEFNPFFKKEETELLNKEFFVSSVVKSFSKLSSSKRIYLLNFPYFIENYPHLVVKSLQAFIDKPNYRGLFLILEDNRIFIPDKVWDILIKKDQYLLIRLIKELPVSTFSFNVDYVSNITKIACFIDPEKYKKIQARLDKVKKLLSDDPTYKIIKKIKEEASRSGFAVSNCQKLEIVKFAMNKVPCNVISWLFTILNPYCPAYDKFSEEQIEDELGFIKKQLKEILAFMEKK